MFSIWAFPCQKKKKTSKTLPFLVLFSIHFSFYFIASLFLFLSSFSFLLYFQYNLLPIHIFIIKLYYPLLPAFIVMISISFKIRFLVLAYIVNIFTHLLMDDTYFKLLIHPFQCSYGLFSLCFSFMVLAILMYLIIFPECSFYPDVIATLSGNVYFVSLRLGSPLCMLRQIWRELGLSA